MREKGVKAVLKTDITGRSAHSHTDDCDADWWAAVKINMRLLTGLWLFAHK